MAITNRALSQFFRDMERTVGSLDPWFDAPAFAHHFVSGSNRSPPTTDLIETKDAYELHAEVPGYDKENIKIEVPNDHTIVLSGTIDKEEKAGSPQAGSSEDVPMQEGPADSQQVTAAVTDKDKQVGKAAAQPQWWVQERVSGSFYRSYQLPVPVNPETIKASCVNGVLKVVVPKTERKKPTQITID